MQIRIIGSCGYGDGVMVVHLSVRCELFERCDRLMEGVPARYPRGLPLWLMSGNCGMRSRGRHRGVFLEGIATWTTVRGHCVGRWCLGGGKVR